MTMAVLAVAQASRETKPTKGPRALGLIEMTNGKARLVPVVILIDGEYFDASAYKADPVPMALWGDTVYEGVKTGVSQGLFTVTSALEKPDTHEWLGEGTWLPASAIHAKAAHKEPPSIPRGLDDDAGPPVLRHEGSHKPKPPEPAPSATPAASPTQTPNPPAATTTASNGPTPEVTSTTAPPPAPVQPDKNIPILKRGKPAPKPPDEFEPDVVTPKSGSKHVSSAKSSAAAAPTQVFPAISAVDGPEPRSYAYPMKPEEEQQFRKQMLAIATDEVRARSRELAAETVPPAAAAKSAHPRGTAAAKLPPPSFEDVKLHVFDLNSSNEPVLILSAKAHLSQNSKQKDSGVEYLVTVVARQDVNTDFHKVLANVTDASHLDAIPQLELIDAVDVDGDGRGELLFRQISDAGAAYVVDRVIGNELYTLFQGTPGE